MSEECGSCGEGAGANACRCCAVDCSAASSDWYGYLHPSDSESCVDVCMQQAECGCENEK